MRNYRLILFSALVITFVFIQFLTYFKNSNQRKNVNLEVNEAEVRQQTKSVEIVASFVSFPTEVEFFQNLIKKYGIDLFITEPAYVFNYLSDTEKQLLIKRQFVDEFGYAASKRDVFSFGIFGENLNQLFSDSGAKLFEELFENGFEKNMHFVSEKLPLATQVAPGFTILHLFLTKNVFDIQITVFYKGEQWLWSGEIDGDKYSKDKNDLYFGGSQQLFDEFTIREIEVKNDVFIKIVNDPKFIANLKYSRFCECYQELATNLSISNPTDVKPSMMKRAIDSLNIMKVLYNELLVPFFLMGGTLLGWYRNCGVIGYDLDNDFAAYALYADYDLTERIREIAIEHDYTLIESFGVPELGYELRMINIDRTDGYNQIDLFYIYDETDGNFFTAYHYYVGDNFFKLKYSRNAIYPLCSAIYVGFKVFVPCFSQKYLEEEYGFDEWYIPNSKGLYHTRVSYVYWTSKDIPYSYQCLGVGTDYKLRRSSNEDDERFESLNYAQRNKTKNHYFVESEVQKCSRVKRNRKNI